MKTLWYFVSRYILKFGSVLATLYLLTMAFLSLDDAYRIPRFYDSGWSMLLIFAGMVLISYSFVKLPFRTKADICQSKGHIKNHCKCARCGAVIDAASHVWDGCKCTVCGTRKDVADPAHTWDGCLCTVCGMHKGATDPSHAWDGCTCSRCGAQSEDDGAHSWETVASTYYGGNDVNGWGPGGETVTQYRCRYCGKGKTETAYDDDFDDG